MTPQPIATVPRDETPVLAYSIAEKFWRFRAFNPLSEDPAIFYSHWMLAPPAPGEQAVMRERRVWEMFVALTGGYYANPAETFTATIQGLHEIARQSVAHHESWERSE